MKLDYVKELSPETFDLHIWRISLRAQIETFDILATFLSENELLKANKFRFEKDRRGYIISHGATREILAQYLKCQPCNVEYKENSFGKPFLKNSASKIFFNLSHSCDWALLAVSNNRQVGIDIEFIRNDFDESEVAQHFFSRTENEVLLSLPKHLRKKAFFDCWTRKEAFIKANGKGLSFSLKEFSVAFAPAERARLVDLENSNLESGGWEIEALEIASNYSAAVAFESGNSKMNFFTWK